MKKGPIGPFFVGCVNGEDNSATGGGFQNGIEPTLLFLLVVQPSTLHPRYR